jgi:hypothetical protein
MEWLMNDELQMKYSESFVTYFHPKSPHLASASDKIYGNFNQHQKLSIHVNTLGPANISENDFSWF